MKNLLNKMKHTKELPQHLYNFGGLYFLILLAGFLNIFNIWNLGVGNSYYAAGIKSMLTSFSNFFFVSFDSSGFISIDKAPLSLWLDATFAKLFGFSGVSILLPHALAGVAVTILVYFIIKKIAGKIPAFFAALAITLSPVNIAVYRNNTPDSLLLVFILLAVWFIIKFFEQKKKLFLILSAVMIGLGFNTKMMQVFLILPALFTALAIFTPGKLLDKAKTLLIFGLVTAFVSFSWVTVVDLTPATLRPYVGGSENNSAWNLALGYNGAQRLLGEQGVGGNAGFNVGEKGLTRLFTGEMGTQTGWLLASAIFYIGYFITTRFKKFKDIILRRKVDFSLHEILTVIATIFFVTQFVFFSYASFFHSYYLNIFALPIVFLFGSLIYEFTKSAAMKKILLGILFASIPLQAYLVYQAQYATWLIPLILVAGTVGALMLFAVRKNALRVVGTTIGIAALFIAPLIWSGYTTLYGNTATAIFVGGPSIRSSNGTGGMNGRDGRMPRFSNNGGACPQLGAAGGPPAGGMPPMGGNGFDGNNRMMGSGFQSGSVDATLLNYLKANYNGEKYFLGVSSQQQAASFILNEDIGNIMTLGGFSGRDKVLSLDEFKQKISDGELRFFMVEQRGMPGGGFGDGMSQQTITASNSSAQTNRAGGGMFNANEDITTWVQENCTAVDGISGLYDCKV